LSESDLIADSQEYDPTDPEASVRVGATTVETAVDRPLGDDGGGPGPSPDAGTVSSCGAVLPSGGLGPVARRTPSRRKVRSLLVGSATATVVVVLLIVVLGSKSGSGSTGAVAPVGSQAPGFSLPPLTGSVPVDLAALGKDVHHPVILNFFASWCGPCQKETPLLARTAAAEQADGGDVQFIGVDVNDQPANALPFVQKAGITYPVGVDQTFRVTSGLYGLNGLPQTFYIDSHGTVVGHTIGAIGVAGLRSWVKKLGEAPPRLPRA
jgi:cytochrome c biogenesis protein CcmG, thiol:disulfide interchange protein DsbE